MYDLLLVSFHGMWKTFFFPPSMWEEVAVMSFAGKSTDLGHVWLSLSLSF